RIMLEPKAGEIGGDLNGALVRREQLEHRGHPPARENRPLRHAEEILQPRSEPGAALSVLDAGSSSTRKGDVIRRDVIECACRLAREPRSESAAKIRFAKLGEAREPTRQIDERSLDGGIVEGGPLDLRTVGFRKLEPRSQAIETFVFREEAEALGSCL